MGGGLVESGLKFPACPRAVLPFSAVLCVALALAFPIVNPDVFFHLSAGRRILELGGVPRADWLSWTRPGAPFVDYEWASQLLYRAVYGLGGVPGLFLLKGTLLLATLAVFEATLSVHAAPPAVRSLATALWACAFLPMADAKPEQFSLLAFSLLFFLLEMDRAGRRTLSWRETGPLFLAWANLHPGVVFGLALLGAYWAAGSGGSRSRTGAGGAPSAAAAMAALAGAFVQPHGLDLFRAVAVHAGAAGSLGSNVSEWTPPSLWNPWYWPFFAIVALGALGIVRCSLGRKRVGLAPGGVFAAFALAGFCAGRFTPYLAVVGLPLAVVWWKDAPHLGASSWRTALPGLMLLGWAASNGAALGSFRGLSNGFYLPAGAVEYLGRRSAELSSLRLFNHSTAGGYIGWRLYRRGFRVFQDGRSDLFLDLYEEERRAGAGPESWKAFLDRHSVELAVVEPEFAAIMEKKDWVVLFSDARGAVLRRAP